MVGQPSRDEVLELDANEIKRNLARIRFLVDRATSQLQFVEDNGIPDSTPFFSFKTAQRIEDLKGNGLGLRANLRLEISKGKAKLKELERDARTLRNSKLARAIEAEEMRLAKADEFADREIDRIIDDAARNRKGKLTEEEFKKIQQLGVSSLNGHLNLVKRFPNKKHVVATFDRLTRLMLLTVDDKAVVAQTFQVVGDATKKMVDNAKKRFLANPNPRLAELLLSNLASNDIVGGENSISIIDREIVPALERDLAQAQKRFRVTPTQENCEAMFNAEFASVKMGGEGLQYPPAGLRRIRPGTTHTIARGETLSGLSKHYYGSFSFWDAIIVANWGIFREPNKPLVGATITIPH